MTLQIQLEKRYNDVTTGTLTVLRDGTQTYKTTCLILNKTADRMMKVEGIHKVRFRADKFYYISFCPTFAIGRKTIPIIPVRGRSLHKHQEYYVYLTNNEGAVTYSDDIVKLAKRIFGHDVSLVITFSELETVESNYFVSSNTVFSSSDIDTYENEEW